MAAIQERSGSFRVLFRYQGKQHAFTLGKVTRAEADATAANIDYVLMRVRQRLLAAPPGVDIVTFVRHDGDPPTSPNQLSAASEAPSSGMLRDRYLETHSNGSLEQTTLDGVRLHFKHLVGTLGERYPVRDLTLADLQRHVDRRAKARGTRGRRLSPATIKKEIVTLRTAWNWGSRMGLLGGKFPYVGLRFPKMDEKPSFRTRDEIERRISSGGMGEAELAEAWDSLYLTSSEIDELLEHVRSVAGHGWIYPMFCVAAHTGARRSEMLRMNLHDLDLGGQTIIIHEKKRARGRRTTRRVPLSPFLIRVLQDWLAVHPGGQYLFCQAAVVTRSKTKRTAPTPITRDEAHDHFKRTLAGSKWGVLRGWHMLRHSFVSLCADRGIDQRLIDEWVGHTTEDMRRRYRHLYPSTQHQAIRSVFAQR